jgi:hypothetical protein
MALAKAISTEALASSAVLNQPVSDPSQSDINQPRHMPCFGLSELHHFMTQPTYSLPTYRACLGSPNSFARQSIMDSIRGHGIDDEINQVFDAEQSGVAIWI